MSFSFDISLFLILLVTPLLAGVIGASDLSSTSTPSLCDCPIILNVEALVCILDWVSHVKILSKTIKTVAGVSFTEYTLEHKFIIQGNLSLPTVLLIPEDSCGLKLEVNTEYLLSGLLTDDFLYTNVCLQILSVVLGMSSTPILSPLWSLVPYNVLSEIISAVQSIVCLLFDHFNLDPIFSAVSSLLQVPSVLNNLPISIKNK